MRWLLIPYREAAEELLAAADAVLARRPARVPASIAALMLTTLASWFPYVPLHELFHAFGCFVTGGRVDELQIAPLYGGRLLESALPFVRARGDYAGRLSGFDTGGSDLVYLATDIAPYLLTIVGALPLLRAARRWRSAFLFGPGAMLMAAPLIGVVGDYFEMAGILVSRVLGCLMPARTFDALRCDDLFLLLAEFPTRFPHHRTAWGLAILATLVLASLLVTATFAAAVWLGRRLTRDPGVAQGRDPSTPVL